MVPVPPERFASALRDLDGPAFAALVADLWSRTGWETARDGQVVVARQRDRTRRLYVCPPRRFERLRSAPSVDEDADAVVTARRGDDADAVTTDGRDVLDADDLRERALYALDPAARSEFFERHLGISPTTSGRGSDSSSRSVSPTASSLRAAAGRTSAVQALGVVAVALVALVAVQALAVGPLAFDDDAASNQSASSDRASAATAAEESDPSDAVPDAYDAEPTCERGPDEVARTLSDAFEAGDTPRSLHTYWDFANPDFKAATSYRHYAALHRSAFQEVVGAASIEHDEPVEVGENRVRVNATVVHEGGEPQAWSYVLEHREEQPREGCWVVNSFSPT